MKPSIKICEKCQYFIKDEQIVTTKNELDKKYFVLHCGCVKPNEPQDYKIIGTIRELDLKFCIFKPFKIPKHCPFILEHLLK